MLFSEFVFYFLIVNNSNRVMEFNSTFNNISVRYIVAVNFIGGVIRSTLRKPLACQKFDDMIK
jgi:hypothetical protein